MGDEIRTGGFQPSDYETFRENLRKETAVLKRWFDQQDADEPIGCERQFGLELETWLVGPDWLPSPKNQLFIDHLQDPMVVPELSAFNVEINAPPMSLGGKSLSRMHEHLTALWERAQRKANELNLKMLMIGTLPTLRDQMLSLEYMSGQERYRVLNEHIMDLRRGRPIQFSLSGREHFETEHEDIMLEAAATSLQIHLEFDPKKAAAFFNASLLASAPMVAVAANAPLFLGRELWSETRIPVFEQALRLPCFKDVEGGMVERVTFGSGYLRNSLLELFLENLDGYPTLLPQVFESASQEELKHLRLHNGTIWRWNRPIVGVDSQSNQSVRIEHRTPPAGPTARDVMGNIAFYLGVVHYLAEELGDDEPEIAFAQAKANFYQAAQHGLDAEFIWPGKGAIGARSLVGEKLIPGAKQALIKLGFDEMDSSRYLENTISPRIQQDQTGASWQVRTLQALKGDFQELTAAYYERQESDLPVGTWTVP